MKKYTVWRSVPKNHGYDFKQFIYAGEIICMYNIDIYYWRKHTNWFNAKVTHTVVEHANHKPYFNNDIY